MKNAIQIFHNTTTFVFPIVVGGDHLAEVCIGTVDELGVEESIRFGVDGVEVEVAIWEEEALGEFAGPEAGKNLMEVLFQGRSILDGECELGQFQGAIDTEFKDLIELLGLLGSNGFVVSIWIVGDELLLMN